MSGKSIVAKRKAPDAVISSAPAALAALYILAQQVKAKSTYSELRDVLREAEGFKAAFKDIDAVKRQAEWVILLAFRRIGIELGKVPKAAGGDRRSKIPARGNLKPGKADTGIERHVRSRMNKIKDKSDGDLRRMAVALWNEGKDATPRGVLVADRQAIKRHKVHKIATAKFSETGPFDTVVIDWPWPMQKIDRDERLNQDAFDYPVMQVEEMQPWWESKIDPKCNPDLHVFIWTTQKFLPITFDLIKACGLRYVLTMVWHKPGGFQPIGLPQYNCEFIVYARKGTPVFTDTKDFDVCHQWPRREHSRKPKEFYELIKRVTGGSRLDVFAREAHDGFARFGNQADHFLEAAQ